jgi:hypothetical protein
MRGWDDIVDNEDEKGNAMTFIFRDETTTMMNIHVKTLPTVTVLMDPSFTVDASSSSQSISSHPQIPSPAQTTRSSHVLELQ